MEDMPTVDITTAIDGTERVRADELRPGDMVFDVWGRGHRLVIVTRGRRHVTTVRRDGVTDKWGPDQTLTVSRPKCGQWHCDAPITFRQAPGEALGVGVWRHVDTSLDYATTGRGHTARPY